MSGERTACPYCGEEILAVARKCKHCHEYLDEEIRPSAPAPVSPPPQVYVQQQPVSTAPSCPHCGAPDVGRVRGVQGFAEVMGVVVGLCLFFIPGIIFYIWIESVPYCQACGKRVFDKW